MSDLAGQAVFICGHPKSGTSLLMALLDSHPQLLVYPEESGFFRRFSRVTAGKSLEEKAVLADEHLLHMFEWDVSNPPSSQEGYPDRDYSAYSFEEVKASYRHWLEQLGYEERNILPAAFLAYGTVSGFLTDRTTRWVEKTPYNEKYSGRIFSLWPEARCIQVIRDPRDNFSSYRKKHPDWSAFDFSYSWRSSTRMAAKNLRRYGPDHCLSVLYEDLLANSSEIMARICAFLGIDDHPTLLQPTKAGKRWGGNSMFGSQFSGVSRAPSGRWRNALSAQEVKEIEAALRILMHRCNYKPEYQLDLSALQSWVKYVVDRRKRDRMRSADHEPAGFQGNEDV